MTVKVGDRIELLNMPEDPDPIPAGTQGTVTNVKNFYFWGDWTQLEVDWDIERTLMVCIPPDRIKVLEAL